ATACKTSADQGRMKPAVSVPPSARAAAQWRDRREPTNPSRLSSTSSTVSRLWIRSCGARRAARRAGRTRRLPLGSVGTEQPRAVGRAESGAAQQGERPDIAGNVLLALQVDAAG